MNNKNKIYRYRSFKTAILELDSGILRAVSIEKNNDPTDGYFELNFNGDNVLWNNFFKNYIKALYLFWTETIIMGDDPKFASKVKIRVSNQYFLEAENFPLSEPIETIFKEFSEMELYKNLVIYLLEKDISENNITVILFFLHELIIEILCNVLEKNGQGELNNHLKCDKKSNPQLSNDFIKYIEALDENNKKEIDIISSIFNNQYKALLSKNKLFLDKAQGEYIKNILNTKNLFPLLYLEELKKSLFPNIYVTSFTTNPGNMCMWAHYTTNHEGICFEYEIDFEEKNLKKINYNKMPNKINFFEHLGRYNMKHLLSNWLTFNGESSSIASNYSDDNFPKKYWELIETLALSKGENWSYEDEYRIWRDDFLNPTEAGYVEIPELHFNKLTGVIFGKNITLENRNKIIEKLQEKINSEELNEIVLYQTVNKFQSYDYEIIRNGIVTKK